MNLKDYKKVKLLDLVDIERAKKNKVYEKGNIIIQVSASKGQIFYLEEKTTVESQYIILTCKNNKIINAKYLYYVISDLLPKFLTKYQTGINIQPEVFNYMELVIHDDIKTQDHIAKIFDKIDEDIKKEEELLKKYQEFKEYHIGKMFV